MTEEEQPIPARTKGDLMRILQAPSWDDLCLLGVTLGRSPNGLGDLILDEIVRRSVDDAMAKAKGETA